MTVNTVIAGASTCTAPYAPTQQSFHTTTFNSSAPNQTTSASIADRLGKMSHVNVRADFGATGDGTTDDTTAIQNAINSLGGSSGLYGRIYFPPGTYKITAPLTATVANSPHSIILTGDGEASVITGSVAGFMIQSTANAVDGTVIIERLKISNTNAAGGGIEIFGTVNAGVEWCFISASMCGVHAEQGATTAIRSCQIIGGGSWPAGGVGVLMRGNGAVYDLDCTSWETGVRFHGGANSLYGGRFERNKTGITLGQSQSIFNGQISGSVLTVNSMLTTQSSGPPAALSVGATVFWNSGGASDTIASLGTGTGGTGTYNLTSGHGTVTAQTMYCIADDHSSATFISAFTMESNDTGIFAFDASGTITNGVISGENTSPSGGSSYGLRLDGFGGLISAVSVSSADVSSFTVAGIATSGVGGLLFQAVSSATQAGGPAWLFSNTAGSNTIAGATFIDCDNPVPAVTFSLRPNSPAIGHQSYFSDSTTNTFAATIAGGAGNHVKGEWNGTNWIVVGVY